MGSDDDNNDDEAKWVRMCTTRKKEIKPSEDQDKRYFSWIK